jgi:hypothetical protein
MFGSLAHWSQAEGWGELDVAGGGHLPVVVYAEELAAAGVREPQVGDRFLFRPGAARRGNGAVDLRPDGWDPAARQKTDVTA